MKKILAIILCLALALTSAISMSISVFADADPIVWDYTKEEATGLVPGNVVHDWGATVTGTPSYDADEKALKVIDGEALAAYGQAYATIENNYQPLADWNVYKYMAICYKTVAINEGTLFYLMTDGAAGFASLPASPDSYNKLVIDTNEGDGIGSHIGLAEATYGGIGLSLAIYDESGISEGGTGYYVKYIAFFATEEEANAFELVEEVDPIVWDYTKEEATGLVPGNVVHDWGATVTGTPSYDADEKALKVIDGEALAAYGQAYATIENNYQPLADWNVYKYMAICYKTVAINEGTLFYLMTDGAAGFASLPASPDSYNKLVIDTNEGDGIGSHIGLAEATYGGIGLSLAIYDESGISEGGTGYYVKYIAFFATEEEANAFELVEDEEPETSEPETSEPETSEPETSEPETSEPETSEPETSEPETSEPETSEPETNSDPIIFNYTVDNDPDTCYPDGGNFLYNWGSSVAGPSAYDADEQAWVMTSEVALGQYATAYDHIWNGSYTSVVDWNTYKYIVFVYKTAGGNETQHYPIMDDGAAAVYDLPASDDGYSKYVASTDAFHDADGEVGYQILPGICNYGADGSEAGVSLAIKYIAFFATEEEANAYDFGIAEPETSEPETSEPETSEPETSEPETSEPETSEPETSEPETSEPETSEPETSEPEGSEESGEESGKEGADTSDVAMISGAILLCAAAGVVAVISKKSKR